MSWPLRGTYFESCNCDPICACRRIDGVVGGRSTHRVCTGVLSWLIALVVSLAGPTAAAPAQDDVLLGPTARLSWSTPDRYARGWSAWRRIHATYTRSYVQPSSWTIVVDGCGSTGRGQRLNRFDVEVTGVDVDYRGATSGPACRRELRDLPRLGTYDVTLIVHTEQGASDRATERVTLRDWLIVSIGDSMASGEGSPDATGRYQLLNDVDSDLKILRFFALLALGHPRPASDADFKVREHVPVRWQDKRCHRSARSGHARAAEAIERRDPHTSVTFVSLACSGAQIGHLLNTGYSGIQPPAVPRPAELRPQLRVLGDLVRGRRIDALLMSIGINDLGFSDIVQRCATNPAAPHYGDPGCVTDGGTYRKLNELAGKYDRLGRALRGLDIAETYITDYPAAPFGRDEGGCGMLGLRLVGIGTQEAEAMFRTGQSFNSRIRAGANRNGWNFPEGMTQSFLGHDYCQDAGDRYFIHLEESLDNQGTEHGTSHPNPRGHLAFASLLTRWIGLGRPAYPFVRAQVTIDQVRLGKSFHDRLDDFRISFHASPQRTVEYRRGVGYMGRWRDIGLQFTADIYDPPRPPRYATKLSFDVRAVNGSRKVIAVNHATSDSWGVGAHEVHSAPTADYPEGYIGVRYHVVAERILDPNRPPVFQP